MSKRLIIPANLRAAWEIEMLQENFSRLFVLSWVMLAVETILLFFEDTFYSTGEAVLGFIIGSVFLVPLITLVHLKKLFDRPLAARLVQDMYLALTLFYGCAVGLIAQPQGDVTHVYVICVFAIGSAIYIHAADVLLILVSGYLTYFLLLPYFLHDDRAVLVLRVNTLVVNILAWLVSRMIYNMKLRNFLDHKLIEEKNAALTHLVSLDQMTWLLNHETAFDRLQDQIDYASQNGMPLSLIIMDIDNFKQINDQHGHLFGDDVIRKVARAIMSAVSMTDIVSRYGGEEFMVIMPDSTEDRAREVAAAIQASIAGIEFETALQVTFSGGISEYLGGTVNDLIAQTDKRLYQAKKQGKNRFISSLSDE